MKQNGTKAGPVEPRFWKHVNKTETCWLWMGAVDRKGYGHFHVGPKITGAHRFSFELAYGPIPAGLLVCHHCDTPACVRPDHLFLGTNQDNRDDAARKGRSRKYPGHSHSFNDQQAAELQRVYARGELTIRQLAEMNGVSLKTMFRALKRGQNNPPRWTRTAESKQRISAALTAAWARRKADGTTSPPDAPEPA